MFITGVLWYSIISKRDVWGELVRIQNGSNITDQAPVVQKVNSIIH